MNRLLTVFCLWAFAGGVSAGTDPLVGSFTHDFTRIKNDSVWTVKKTGSVWKVRVHGSNEIAGARLVSDSEKAAFWEQMWWPADKAKDAQCLRIEEQSQGMMCYVRGSTRAGIGGLSKHKSDYFYFDAMGGLMEIRRKGA
ncbi:hypothetical protein [Massilia suwonensis]|uniref:DUF995 domain-containing protein n=1 Tax=Massilia suwonensis TaxID=648895 RepID=A0ABW0MHR0_9BURK